MSWTPDKEARHQESRAEVAEARVVELEAALRKLIDSVPGNHPGRDSALWVLLGGK